MYHKTNSIVHSSFRKARIIVAQSHSVRIDNAACRALGRRMVHYTPTFVSWGLDYAQEVFLKCCRVASARFGRDIDFSKGKAGSALASILKESFDPIKVRYRFDHQTIDSMLYKLPWAFAEIPLCLSAVQSLQDFSFWAEGKGISVDFDLHAVAGEEAIATLINDEAVVSNQRHNAFDISLDLEAAAIIAVDLIAQHASIPRHYVLHSLLNDFAVTTPKRAAIA